MHCPTMESINGNCPGMWIINVIKSGKCPLHTQMVFDFISYPHDVHLNKTVNDSPPSRIFADLLSPGHSTLWFVSVQVLSLPEVTQLRHGSTNPHLFGYQIGSVETFRGKLLSIVYVNSTFHRSQCRSGEESLIWLFFLFLFR